MGNERRKIPSAGIYAYAYSVGGRLAGEHGIGAKKLKYMEEFTPKGELAIMKNHQTSHGSQQHPQSRKTD